MHLCECDAVVLWDFEGESSTLNDVHSRLEEAKQRVYFLNIKHRPVHTIKLWGWLSSLRQEGTAWRMD